MIVLFIKISPKYVPKDPINYKLTVVPVLAWRQESDNSPPIPMMSHFTDTYMHHQAQWGLIEDKINCFSMQLFELRCKSHSFQIFSIDIDPLLVQIIARRQNLSELSMVYFTEI